MGGKGVVGWGKEMGELGEGGLRWVARGVNEEGEGGGGAGRGVKVEERGRWGGGKGKVRRGKGGRLKRESLNLLFRAFKRNQTTSSIFLSENCAGDTCQMREKNKRELLSKEAL